MNSPPRHRTDTITRDNVRHALAVHPGASPAEVVRFILAGAWGSAPTKLVKKVAAIMATLKR